MDRITFQSLPKDKQIEAIAIYKQMDIGREKIKSDNDLNTREKKEHIDKIKSLTRQRINNLIKRGQ